MRKMYEDGGNLVLILENTPEMRAYLERVFSPEVIGESKQKPHRSVVLNYDRYTGRTVEEVLLNEGDKAYANIQILLAYKMIPKEYEQATRDELNAYITKRFQSIGDARSYVENATDEEVENFFKFLQYAFPEEKKRRCCDKTGTATFNDFIKESSADVKRSSMLYILT